MRLADYPRALNRAAINDLFNGAPPYTEEEATQNRIETNVNFLDGTEVLHDARRQFSTAFLNPDPLFSVSLDTGPAWKRREWGTIIQNNINRIIKKSLPYLELRRSVFAGTVLHGIGPSMWQNRESWCPRAVGIEDVLIPSNTLLSMENLPFFAVYRQYTGAELDRLTSGPKVDPAWNLPVVKRAIEWVDEQARQLMSASWPEVWSPEKMSERIKQDGGLYSSDAVPTIDTFDLYFWNDDGRRSGWNRRIVLDAWGSPGVGGVGGWAGKGPQDRKVADKNMLDGRNEFLYNPGNRIYANALPEIVHWQFADCSCVPPFRYHSVRSLGFLLYAVCHLQNRLRCKFNDHVFENLIQYFRVSNPADAERLTKVDLIDKGIIPEGLNFVKQEERWQINDSVVDRAMEMNSQTINDRSASFAPDVGAGDQKEETATRTMAKINASAALVGSMLNQAYDYQAFQYHEICRRFCVKNSRDGDVRKFRLQCLKAGVPEEMLRVEAWDVQPMRVIGQGNKMLQVAMADKLMALVPGLDPEGQKTVKRIYVVANSDDPNLANQIIPDHKPVSSTVIQAQNDAATLMAGLPLSMQTGINHAEYIEAQIHSMAAKVAEIEQRGGMATPEEVRGLGALAKNIEQHIALVAQDESAKENVRKWGDDLKQLTNMLKAYAQRLQEAQKQSAGNGQMDPKDQAKIQATVLTAQTKNKLAAESHAQKTAQRQVAFEQQLKQDAAKHDAHLAKTDLESAATIKRGGMASFKE